MPETPQGERNWDYRYSWIRDSTFMLWALLSLGFEWEANDFFYFIADVASGEEKLQVMYGLDGERQLDEQTLDHLEGYERARPVRVGNGAYSQEQHDVWGALLDSVWIHTRSRDSLDDRVWKMLSRQVEQAIKHWRKPDRGIWEVRGEPKHFTSSKMFCWVACDRGSRLAELREDADRAQRWRDVADEIHADICEHGVDERGVFVQHYGTTALDAALLLLPLMRFLPADDPRIIATVIAIADELTEHGLVLRYRTEETDDGLEGREGSLLICSFWLVSALCEIGELERARSLCERLLGYASPLGLYAEEIDPITGRHLGNFPQAFTHLALINACCTSSAPTAGSGASHRSWASGLYAIGPPTARSRGLCDLGVYAFVCAHLPGASGARARTERDRESLELVDEPGLDLSSTLPGGAPSPDTGGRVSSNITLSSSRARAAPRQKCRPPAPNAWCSGFRRDVEAVRVRVAGLVAVGRHVPHHDLVALTDPAATELDVTGRGPPEVRERGKHPQ